MRIWSFQMKNSGFIYDLLRDQKADDLAHVYKLFSRVQGGPKTMLSYVSNYFREQGESLLREDGSGDATSFVQVLSFYIYKSYSNE